MPRLYIIMKDQIMVHGTKAGFLISDDGYSISFRNENDEEKSLEMKDIYLITTTRPATYKPEIDETVKFITISRLASLNDSIGFLNNWNDEGKIVDESGKIDVDKTLAFNELAEVNKRQKELIKYILS